MAAAPSLTFTTEFDAQNGMLVPVAPGIARVTAPNISPYTFTGTNSYVLGTERVAVLDPGPEDLNHLEALRRAIADRPVEAILLSHTHNDHSGLAPALQAMTGAPYWVIPGGSTIDGSKSAHGTDLVPGRALADGERITLAGLELEVLSTPGHAADHAAFGLIGTDILFTGDHIMGWNSTVISGADGSLQQYFDSLDKVIAAPYATYLSGHGAPITNGPAFARALKAHREARNQQIRVELGKGQATMGSLLDAIYPTLSAGLRVLAKSTLTAHLEYLEGRGEAVIDRGLLGWTIRAA